MKDLAVNPKCKALITGAAGGGIGTATAERLAARGDIVFINGREEKGTLAAAKKLASGGGNVRPVPGDVACQKDVERIYKVIISDDVPLSCLVLNAAPSYPFMDVTTLSIENWRNEVRDILDSAFLVLKAFLPGMYKARWGRIVLISSSAVFRGSWGRAISYAAGKAAYHGIVSQLALEAAEFNVTVNAVAPSQILTPRILRNGRRSEESIAIASKNAPMARTGRTEEVASVVEFLTSEGASYLTGQIIRVDGGSSLSPRN